MLTIGVIGLGTIAQKAYLPVYAQMQKQVHWLLNTRNEDKLEQLSAQYGLESAGHSLQDLDGQPLEAVMIHTPTATHYQYVKHFLEKGVHVFVDKPLATDMAQVNELYDLADAKHVMLTVGFNRRFAPMIQDLAQVTDKTGVRVDKNRIDALDDTEHALWDLFIHPVDTALMLAGYPEKPNTRYALHTTSDGQLQQASVTFTRQGLTYKQAPTLKRHKWQLQAAFNASKTWINSSCMAVVALHKPLPQIGSLCLKPGDLRQWYRHLSRPWVIQMARIRYHRQPVN